MDRDLRDHAAGRMLDGLDVGLHHQIARHHDGARQRHQRHPAACQPADDEQRPQACAQFALIGARRPHHDAFAGRARHIRRSIAIGEECDASGQAIADDPRHGTIARHRARRARRRQLGSLDARRQPCVVDRQNLGPRPRHVHERRIVGRDDRTARLPFIPPRIVCRSIACRAARAARRWRGHELRLTRAASAARRRRLGIENLGLGSEGAEPIQHPSHLAFLFRPLRPGLARTPPALTWFVIRRAAKRRPLVLLIVVLEGLPQSLQFEDQRLALRRRDILIRSPDPAAHNSFIGMHVIKTLHDETLSASDGRCSALACGGGCGDPGGPLPPALRTRANTSALGPNAIALPS